MNNKKILIIVALIIGGGIIGSVAARMYYGNLPDTEIHYPVSEVDTLKNQ